MKNNVITAARIIYTLAFGAWATTWVGTEDMASKLFIGVLGAQLCLGVYILLVLLINIIVGITKIKIKLPIPKRFLNKVTPIYELKLYDTEYFRVTKYYLNWTDFKPSDYEFWILPFSSLLQRWKYCEAEGFYFMTDITNITDISVLWEDRCKELYGGKAEEQKETDIVNNLNKIFLENYED